MESLAGRSGREKALRCPSLAPSTAPTATKEVLTDSNLQTAVDLWISDPGTATETYGLIGNWDVSAITTMSYLFRFKTFFNDDISQWDVSGVTDMSGVFYGASAFNQDLSE